MVFFSTTAFRGQYGAKTETKRNERDRIETKDLPRYYWMSTGETVLVRAHSAVPICVV